MLGAVAPPVTEARAALRLQTRPKRRAKRVDTHGFEPRAPPQAKRMRCQCATRPSERTRAAAKLRWSPWGINVHKFLTSLLGER